MVAIDKRSVRAWAVCAAMAAGLALLPAASRAVESGSATSFAGIGAAMEQESALRRALQPDIRAGEAVEPAIAEAVRRFYDQAGYRLAWQGPASRTAAASLLIETLDRASVEGLPPAAYEVPMLRAALAAPEMAPETRDILFTQAFFRYARDVRDGRLPEDQLPDIWAIPHERGDLARPLASALEEGQIETLLRSLPPHGEAYRDLKAVLMRYRAIAERGGWPLVGGGETLHVGDADPRVPALRQRLMTVGDLPPVVPLDDPLYDDAVSTAVAAFQARHGLKIDGLVGRNTLAALDRTVEQRIRQIVVNLDRLRHLPREREKRRVEVNIANASLTYFEDDRPALRSAVIVGAPGNQTPVLATRMTAVVANPAWTIPFSIASKEILPKLQHDPFHLLDRNMRIVDRPEDPFGFGVDWNAMSARTFPFTLQQRPGPGNALGRVKFAGGNRFSIFLHDTPRRSLFGRADRMLSHGCIRVQAVDRLARAVFGRDGTPDAFEEALAEGTETTWFPLAQPVAIYLEYLTAFVENGATHFRADAYGRDALYAERLLDRHPSELLGAVEESSAEKSQQG